MAYALVVVAALALAVRRRWPLATLARGDRGDRAAYLVLGYPYGPILLSFLVAVYTVARAPAAAAGRRPPAASRWSSLLVHVFVGVRRRPRAGRAGARRRRGWSCRSRSGSRSRLQPRGGRPGRAGRRPGGIADDERLRVAQEVHDVVGHGLAAINMQAEIALHLLAKRAASRPRRR